MIVVESIDVLTRRAVFRMLSGDPNSWREEFARVGATAGRLGIRDLGFSIGEPSRGATGIEAYIGRDHSSNGEEGLGQSLDTDSRAFVPVNTAPRLHHSVRIENGHPLYDLGFDRVPESRPLVGTCAGLVLSTFGPQNTDLMGLRIVIYEICANIIDHGVAQIRAESLPLGNGADIQLQLRFGDGSIAGHIQDRCERFDPTSVGEVHIADRIAQRFKRGYGISMVSQLLDGFEHEFNRWGNRISFSKRIEK